MIIKNLRKLALLFVLILSVSCSENDPVDNAGNEEELNSTAVYITDSPVDQANIEAIFITVSEVRINGKPIEGFNKTTLEISSLNKGNTELLGNTNLEAGTTSNITLILAETDDKNTGPGNYVVLDGGAKQELSSAVEINLKDQVQILENTSNEVVLDFDLRKSLKQEGDNYSFVSRTHLEKNIRAVNTLNTGFVTGNVDNTSTANAEVIVAYIYKKDTYDSSESNTNAEGIAFANATSSSVVSDSNGEFEIHFLEEGEYELHFASYNDNDQDGKLNFSGMVEASALSSINLSEFEIESNSEVNVQISFTGLLDL